MVGGITVDYSNLTGMNRYVGLRYVPIIAGEWNSTINYEPLTIVLYQGASYTSKTFVPVGIPPTNTAYWALTGNYDAQVAMYLEEVRQLREEVKKTAKKYETALNMIADTEVSVGDTIITEGYKTVNDGYGGLYEISSTQVPYSVPLANGTFANIIGDTVIPQQIGAACDGVTNDTAILNVCFSNFKKIILTGGTYSVAVTSNNGIALNVSSGNNIVFKKATIELKPNNFTNYVIVGITDVNNILIEGVGSVKGDRTTHTGTTGEWGHCVGMTNSTNVTINNIEIINGWGDGIYIGSSNSIPGSYCSNINFNGIKCNNNGRNNLSVISVDGLFINGSEFKGATRTAPKAGIDIEPNNTQQTISNIIISDCDTTENAGGSFGVYNPYVSGASVKFNNIRCNSIFVTNVGDGCNYSLSNISMYADNTNACMGLGNQSKTSSINISDVYIDATRKTKPTDANCSLITYSSDYLYNCAVNNVTLYGGQLFRLGVFASAAANMHAGNNTLTNFKMYGTTVAQDSLLLIDNEYTGYYTRGNHPLLDNVATSNPMNLGHTYTSYNITDTTGTTRVYVPKRSSGNTIKIKNSTSGNVLLDFSYANCVINGAVVGTFNLDPGKIFVGEYDWSINDFVIGTILVNQTTSA